MTTETDLTQQLADAWLSYTESQRIFNNRSYRARRTPHGQADSRHLDRLLSVIIRLEKKVRKHDKRD